MVWNSPNRALNMPKKASKSYWLAQVGHDIQIVSHIIYLHGTEKAVQHLQNLEVDQVSNGSREIASKSQFDQFPTRRILRFLSKHMSVDLETSFVLNIQPKCLLYKKLVVWWSIYNYWYAAVEQNSTSEHQIWQPYNWRPHVCFLLQAKSLSLHGIYNKRPATICQYKKALGLNYL
jgi:hypothetical protein